MALIPASRSCPRARRAHGCPQAPAPAWLCQQACLWARLGRTLGRPALLSGRKRSERRGLVARRAGGVQALLAMLWRPVACEQRGGTFLS